MSVRSDVCVGSKWRNKRSGIVATVEQVKGDCARLKREKRATTWKWLDLLLLDYELVTDEQVSP
jgi:hypothetical protein